MVTLKVIKRLMKKTGGSKISFFLQYVKNFVGKDNAQNNLQISLQEVSNDKYLKLYKIDTNIIDHEVDTLESSLSFKRMMIFFSD